MKTKIKFQKADAVAIIFPEKMNDEIRDCVSKCKIMKTYSPAVRKDENYALVIDDMPLDILFDFIRNKYIEVVEYTLIYGFGIYAQYKIKNNVIQNVFIGFVDGHYKNSKEPLYRDLVYLYNNGGLSTPITSYTISWMAIGSVNIEMAEKFSVCLELAIKIAKELTAELNKNKN